MNSEMPPKLTPKIILEGTRLTHKTDIAFALNEHPRIVGPAEVPLPFAAHFRRVVRLHQFPLGAGPDQFRRSRKRRWPWRPTAPGPHLFELLKYYSWIVDRFHVSTIVYQQRQGRAYDFRWLEERLLPLGFCARPVRAAPRTRSPRAREERLAVSGNPGQYRDLEPFIREQDEMRDAIGEFAAAPSGDRRLGRRYPRAPAAASPTGCRSTSCWAFISGFPARRQGLPGRGLGLRATFLA